MIEAVGKSIIIKPVYEEKKGQLILTDHDNKPIAWEVISIGEDVKCLDIGNKIALSTYGMQVIMYKGDKYYICQIENVLAKNVL